jgi:hypothetical protein
MNGQDFLAGLMTGLSLAIIAHQYIVTQKMKADAELTCQSFKRKRDEREAEQAVRTLRNELNV